MKSQPSINPRMRAILVDWLVEVQMDFDFVPEILYLAVHIIDRFLSRTKVCLEDFQLLGITALMIAEKYESDFQHSVSLFIDECDGSYSTEAIIEMEIRVLSTIGYRVTVATSFTFLMHFFEIDSTKDADVMYLSKYILNCTLECYGLLVYTPYRLAIASIAIAHHSLGHCKWDSSFLVPGGNATMKKILDTANHILSERERCPTKMLALNRKFSKPGFRNMSERKLAVPRAV